MAKQPLSPEAEKILTARREAAAELKAIDGVDRKATDPAVIRLSNARLYEANITMRVLAGESVTAAEFKAAGEMVEFARNATPQPIAVNIEVVEGILHCPKCGYHGGDLRPLPRKPSYAPTIDGEVAKPAATVEAAKALPAPIIEPPPPKAFEPAHDFHKGAPLRNGAEAWRPYARQGTITDGGMGVPYHVHDSRRGSR
jgi:hypothetical protein